MQNEEFSWDDEKAASNLRKHNVSFDEARSVFADIMRTDLGEDRRGYDEQRFNVIGRSGNRLLFVTYTERSDLIHIISARPAEKHERAYWINNNPPEHF